MTPGGRLRAAAARRGRAALDVALAAVLAAGGAIGGLDAPDFPHPGPTTSALMALAGATQVLRRVRPLTACAGSFAAMAVVALLYGPYQSGASVLIAITAAYSAVVHGRDLRFVLAVLVAFAAVLSLGQPWGVAVGTMVFTLTVLGLVVAGGLAVRTWRNRAAAAQQREQALERDRQAAVADAAAGERRRIARELHDVLSHSLGVVVLQAGAADAALDRDPARARDSLHAVRETAQAAIREMQTLVTMARSVDPGERAPQPTLADLPALLDQTRAAGIRVELVTEGDPRPVPPALQASVYRVAQEGLTNVLKHAAGGRAVLALRYRPDEVEIEVRNEIPAGVGPGPGSRLGLIGVHERVTVFGGRLHAGPGADGGWGLRAVFPLA